MKEDIRPLLDRFYRGATSIEEERRLIEHLLSDDCPEELLAERHAIISLACPEAISQPLRLEQRIAEVLQPSRRRWWWIGIAASLLIIIGIGFWALLPKESQPQPARQEVVAEAAKPVISEPISSPTIQPQPEKPKAPKRPKRTQRGQAPLCPDSSLKRESTPIEQVLQRPLTYRRDDLCHRIKMSFPPRYEL